VVLLDAWAVVVLEAPLGALPDQLRPAFRDASVDALLQEPLASRRVLPRNAEFLVLQPQVVREKTDSSDS